MEREVAYFCCPDCDGILENVLNIKLIPHELEDDTFIVLRKTIIDTVGISQRLYKNILPYVATNFTIEGKDFKNLNIFYCNNCQISWRETESGDLSNGLSSEESLSFIEEEPESQEYPDGTSEGDEDTEILISDSE
jgi:hypothetical protein